MLGLLLNIEKDLIILFLSLNKSSRMLTTILEDSAVSV